MVKSAKIEMWKRNHKCLLRSQTTRWHFSEPLSEGKGYGKECQTWKRNHKCLLSSQTTRWHFSEPLLEGKGYGKECQTWKRNRKCLLHSQTTRWHVSEPLSEGKGYYICFYNISISSISVTLLSLNHQGKLPFLLRIIQIPPRIWLVHSLYLLTWFSYEKVIRS